MCCGRRRNGGVYTPATVVLGKMAWDKYQQHKARRLNTNGQQLELPGLENDALSPNSEVMEKTRMDPPSYNEVVASRAMVPQPTFEDEKKSMGQAGQYSIANIYDEEQLRDVPNGMNYQIVPLAPHMCSYNGCQNHCQPHRCQPSGCQNKCQQHMYMAPRSGCQSRCQQKRMEKAARKAEKAAAKQMRA